jgi:hypothetical protein
MLTGVVELGPSLDILRADAALCLILGLPAGELAQRTLGDVVDLAGADQELCLAKLMGYEARRAGGMKKAHVHKVGPRKTFSGVHPDKRALHISLQVRLR